MANSTTNYNLKKPLGNENYNVEDQNGNMDILDAQIKIVDNKASNVTVPVTKVNNKIGDVVLNAADVGAVSTGDFTSHLANNSTYSTYKLNVDANGIFTEIQYKRQDSTLILKSILSGGISSLYTTRTETEYLADGITVKATRVYNITYMDDKITSEVLQ
ncbi:hypothetical protein [Clostridium sp.]|jgi:isopentenyl phosphate kinase|uniref:hypothetical protein n=1 Tax=Clostridium sp. TaxID=1506 RepID=UPI003EEE2062